MIAISDIHWIAGFLEGEGSFTMSPGLRVSAQQKDPETLYRLSRILGGKVWKVSTRDCYGWSITGSRAASISLMLYSLMSERRKGQIQEALGEWMQKPVAKAEQTHCIHGHPFDEKNTYWYKGRHRHCRACSAARMRRYSRVMKSA